MMDRSSEPHAVSEEDARRLWQRAVELQQEAERASQPQSSSVAPHDADLTLEQVAHAAEGAGIGAEFMQLAIAEMQLPDADEISREARSARWLRRLVSNTDALEATRLVPGTPQEALAALRRTAATPAYALTLERTVGPAGDAADRVIVFRVVSGASQFATILDLADVRVLLVTLRRQDQGTLIRIRAPLYRRGVNLTVAGGLSALTGTGASVAGWAGASWVAGALGVAAGGALLVPAGIAAAAGGVLGLRAFRSFHGAFSSRGATALNTFLGSVAMEFDAPLPPAS